MRKPGHSPTESFPHPPLDTPVSIKSGESPEPGASRALAFNCIQGKRYDRKSGLRSFLLKTLHTFQGEGDHNMQDAIIDQPRSPAILPQMASATNPTPL